jgi:putative colanic acid biosynthesis acetyltransferase WcaF
MFAWRACLLRCFGARIGQRVHIYPRADIALPWMLEVADDVAIADEVLVYDLGLVRIGARATISHRAQICAGTHDYRDRTLPLRRVPVTIGSDAWICTAALIGPEVVVGEGAVVGAGAVVLKDVEPWTVVVGNPAQTVKRRELRAP